MNQWPRRTDQRIGSRLQRRPAGTTRNWVTWVGTVTNTRESRFIITFRGSMDSLMGGISTSRVSQMKGEGTISGTVCLFDPMGPHPRGPRILLRVRYRQWSRQRSLPSLALHRRYNTAETSSAAGEALSSKMARRIELRLPSPIAFPTMFLIGLVLPLPLYALCQAGYFPCS